MNQYVTGEMIRKLREERKMTQVQLASLLNVSDKAVSKWENGRGYPDISLLEPLAKALRLSVAELLAGESVINTNRSFNMKRMKFYVCPICGNVIFSSGEAMINCCGITLQPLEAEKPDPEHVIHMEESEDEYYVCSPHDMSREHYISFMAVVRDDGCEIRKLYPEGPAEARFKRRGSGWICFFCNRHGLYRTILPKSKHETVQRPHIE